MPKHAIIIGAGPAGLTAALELLRHSDIKPIVLEADDCVGGISRTVNYRGNRIDIGGHRFFSKSDWVMDWWKNILPVYAPGLAVTDISYQNKTRQISTDAATVNPDEVFLIRNRLSRIYFLRKFFDYPIKLSVNTVANLGLVRMVKIGLSYVRVHFNPRTPEASLEDFLINRFGRELYLTFFKDYTEKVWGVPCEQISAEWGAQRIKGLSIRSALAHAFTKLLPKRVDTAQKKVNTSLIERFLYPKFGPGQMWETVARQVEGMGGEVRLRHRVCSLIRAGDRITGVEAENLVTGERVRLEADFVCSSMPVKDLVAALGDTVPTDIQKLASTLPYRDFLTVGLLVRNMKPNAQARSTEENHMPPDNWIYIQERDVKIGRLQIFNNWSPSMVQDPDTIWLGLEYFCNEGDELWQQSDEQLKALGQHELAKIGLIDEDAVLDSVVIRMPKAYPAYFGSYTRFNEIRAHLDPIENLFLIGRNGMHRYNNQDHSMMTAKLAVDHIIAGNKDKSALWAVNIDDDYHEEQKDS
ncbi:NAD(P)/FAD-dependent oxidoreductase [Candidatus Igneacidithiobacillus taiwanensis]|uniref:NAD(P)/FAD-dependent oxidoreductase n=1 Tax=Candidatus Igneacidithiobacillus taiwanensis TaxID=1945924 RepID=UPI002896B404|nr:NAD(P)/FAD-dependent oxidoreductase [Candidatus Igneacidithiobacillus taiwanensis]